MRKITFLFTLLLGYAILFTSFGQVKKNVIFEHFTNASCGPCASQNPVFQDNILSQNFGRIHHIAYHTSWPGTDPMNAYNPTEVQARVSYYGVSAVPNMRMQGNKYNGGPAGVTQEMIDNAASESSPIRIKVKETTNGTNRDVVVTIYTVGIQPTGVLKLRVAVVESEINYATAPGSNGEKYFPNVFRKMLPNTTGDTYSPAATGDSVIFNYSYALDLANWDTSRIYSIAYVQNNSGKEILNSGSAPDPEWELVSQDTLFKKGTIGNTTNFSTQLSNLANLSENFRIKFYSDEPVDWSSSFEYNSVNYTESVDINMNPKTSLDIAISVQPGTTPAIGEYRLTFESLDNPEFAPQVLRFYVISGITDLIVNGSGGWGDGEQYDFEQEYFDALSYAGNTSYAATSANIMVKGFDYNVLTDVNNIYMNISWTFPSLADDEAIALENFMDNGGNMFISGQDIGWDIMSGDGYGTATTQSFYTNYLHASYISDGSSSNNLLTANSSDGIFGGVANSSIAGVYGTGNEFMYPDQVNPAGIGQEIFYYNSNPSVISGIRANNGTYKMIYLAVDVQMLTDNNVKNEIIKRSHDWFYGYSIDQVINCNGECNGVATIVFDDGISPYNYFWDDPASQTTVTATGLCAGSYNVSIIDSANDTIVQSVTITEPEILSIITTLTDATCDTCNDGSATVTASGSSGNYTYLWNDANSQTTATASNLMPGEYIVTVTDIDCSESITDTVTVGFSSGIENANLDATINIYPNPATDKLTIEIESNELKNFFIEVFDIVGNKIYESKQDNKTTLSHTIDFSSQRAGIYLLKIRAGNSFTVYKFILSK